MSLEWGSRAVYMYQGPPRPLTPGQKLTIAAARERSERRRVPKSARSQSVPPTRSGQKAVVLSPQPLRVREEASKSSRRCGKLKSGTYAQILGIEGNRAEIRIPGKTATGWVTTEQSRGKVLLGLDIDWDHHVERMKPAKDSIFAADNMEDIGMSRLVARLDPSNIAGASDAGRNADRRRKQEEWTSRREQESVKLLNAISVKKYNPKPAKHEGEEQQSKEEAQPVVDVEELSSR